MSASEVYSAQEEEAAFGEVYRAHHAKLLRYCQYRLRDRYEAEDVAQEAFARAWRTMPTSAYDRNFYPWLKVVAGNLCTDIQRKRSRSEPVAVIDAVIVDADIERITEESDRVLVRQALGRLNDRHRSALLMRESEGLTYDQIAARTGATSATVESLLWRARQALKREFTVIAGGEGALAVVGFVVIVAAHMRAAGRRAYVRVARRVPGLDPAADNAAAHVAVAALAALTVATGVVATLGLTGGSHSSSPIVVHEQIAPASVTTAAPNAAAPSPSAPAPAATTAKAAPSTSPTVAAYPAAVSGSARPADTTQSAPLRVVSPVAVGAKSAPYAHYAPVTLSVGPFTLGASPPAAAGYVQEITNRLANPSSVLPTGIPLVKESK